MFEINWACFNPSQVGYKPNLRQRLLHLTPQFQSLTGRLQTPHAANPLSKTSPFQSLTGRLQTAHALAQ